MRYLVAAVLVVLAMAGCSAAGNHSYEWHAGYRFGEKVYNQLNDTSLASHVKKDPNNLQLVNYCDQQAMGMGPTVKPTDPEQVRAEEARRHDGPVGRRIQRRLLRRMSRDLRRHPRLRPSHCAENRGGSQTRSQNRADQLRLQQMT